MPKIALKVKSAIELLIINYYYWSSRTTKMQTENRGTMRHHWENKQDGNKGPVLNTEELQNKSQESWQGGILQPTQEEWTDMEILFFIFQDSISNTNKIQMTQCSLLHAKASNGVGSESALNQAELRSVGTSYCSAEAKRNFAI